MHKNLFRIVFWCGYFAVLVTSLININGGFNRIKIGPDFFNIRLDHLLHFIVYLMICIYFLAGEKYGLSLFNNHSFLKFIFLVLFLAIVTEVMQLWISGRSFNVFDLISNVAGMVSGVGVIRMAQRRRGVSDRSIVFQQPLV